MRSDQETEYINEKFKNILQEAGIRHQLTVGYSPEQNGTTERMNCSIVEKVRSILIDAKLLKGYWAEAVSTVAYLINRNPTKPNESKTAEEIWTGNTPNLNNLRTFGCKAKVHISKQKKQKLDPKSEEHIFIGYCEDTKEYRFIKPKTEKITIAQDVVFLENNPDQHFIKIIEEDENLKEKKVDKQMINVLTLGYTEGEENGNSEKESEETSTGNTSYEDASAFEDSNEDVQLVEAVQVAPVNTRIS